MYFILINDCIDDYVRTSRLLLEGWVIALWDHITIPGFHITGCPVARGNHFLLSGNQMLTPGCPTGQPKVVLYVFAFILSGNQNVLWGNLKLKLVIRQGNWFAKRMWNPVYIKNAKATSYRWSSELIDKENPGKLQYMKAESVSFGIFAIIKREEIRQRTCQSKHLVNKIPNVYPDNVI